VLLCSTAVAAGSARTDLAPCRLTIGFLDLRLV
jgi:hypothetical protein